MPHATFSDADLWEAVGEIQELLESLVPTATIFEAMNLMDADATPIHHQGNLSEISATLYESFQNLNAEVPVPEGFEVELGIIDENSQDGYLQIMWRIKKQPDGGSYNIPHVIVRRSDDTFEIYLPE